MRVLSYVSSSLWSAWDILPQLFDLSSTPKQKHLCDKWQSRGVMQDVLYFQVYGIVTILYICYLLWNIMWVVLYLFLDTFLKKNTCIQRVKSIYTRLSVPILLMIRKIKQKLNFLHSISCHISNYWYIYLFTVINISLLRSKIVNFH